MERLKDLMKAGAKSPVSKKALQLADELHEKMQQIPVERDRHDFRTQAMAAIATEVYIGLHAERADRISKLEAVQVKWTRGEKERWYDDKRLIELERIRLGALGKDKLETEIDKLLASTDPVSAWRVDLAIGEGRRRGIDVLDTMVEKYPDYRSPWEKTPEGKKLVSEIGLMNDPPAGCIPIENEGNTTLVNINDYLDDLEIGGDEDEGN